MNSQHLNQLPLHRVVTTKGETQEEMVRLLLAAYKHAVNIPDDHGWLPIHYAVEYASCNILKLIAEENISNLSVMLPVGKESVAHLSANVHEVDSVKYIHSKLSELLSSVNSINGRTPLHNIINGNTITKSFEYLSNPLSPASDVLRFLLRQCPKLGHCPGLYWQYIVRPSTSRDCWLAWLMPADCCYYRGLHRSTLVFCR